MTQSVFIVHGHDEAMREEVAAFIHEIGYNPVILHERPNRGRTIIEKFEQEAADMGFAVVLLSPDDFGGKAGHENELNPRARQNVILELGYFVASLGRERVCPLYKGDVELPSDILGVLYVLFDTDGAWKLQLIREMEAVDMEAITSPILSTEAIEADSAAQVPLLPNLRVPKAEVEGKIKIQIEAGREIARRRIRAISGLKAAQVMQGDWNSYNIELLARSFDSSILAEKYQQVIASPNATYRKAAGGRTIMRDEIERGIRLLGSIVQRLELLPDHQVTINPSLVDTRGKHTYPIGEVSPLTAEAIAPTVSRVRLKVAGEYVLPEHPSRNRINVLKFTPDGRFLVSGLNQDRVAIWDTVTKELRNMDAPASSAQRAESMDWPTYAISISPDNKFLATPTYNRAIQIWHFRGLKPYKLIKTVNHMPVTLSFSSDSDWLVAGLDTDGYVFSWSVGDDFRSTDHVKAHEQRVTALKFHPSQLNFVSSSVDGTIKHWEIVDEAIRAIHSYIGHDQEHVVDIAFSPDGRLLASGSARGQIMLWEVATGKIVAEFTHETVVRAVAFSPDSRLLASGSNDRSLKIWDVVNGDKLLSKKFDHAVRTVDFSPDGQRLVVADDANKKAQQFLVEIAQ